VPQRGLHSQDEEKTTLLRSLKKAESRIYEIEVTVD